MESTTGSGALLLSLCIAIAVLAVAAGMLFVSSLLERGERPRQTPERRYLNDRTTARTR